MMAPDRVSKPVGGMGVQVFNLTAALSKDFDFDLIGYPDEDPPSNYFGVENPLPRIPHSALTTLASQIAYYAKAEKLPKPDLVHAQDWSTYLAGIYTAEYFNVPLVVSMNLSVIMLETIGVVFAKDFGAWDGYWLHRTHCEIELLGLRKAEKIIHVSEGYRKRFGHINEFDKKTVVVPNGIELKDWEKFQNIKLPGKNKIKVVFIGRPAIMKGVIPLCEAKIPKEIDLIFITPETGGEFDTHQKIVEKVEKEDNVYYMGPLFDKDKINALCTADAVIMPSRQEPFGIVALEALASKSILLSSFADGMSDFLTEEIALNCGTTKESIEKSLKQVVKMSEAEKKYRIERGLEVCQKYTWENAAKKMKAVYDEVINNYLNDPKNLKKDEKTHSNNRS